MRNSCRLNFSIFQTAFTDTKTPGVNKWNTRFLMEKLRVTSRCNLYYLMFSHPKPKKKKKHRKIWEKVKRKKKKT